MEMKVISMTIKCINDLHHNLYECLLWPTGRLWMGDVSSCQSCTRTMPLKQLHQSGTKVTVASMKFLGKYFDITLEIKYINIVNVVY